jgi:DNA-directed RNA polymerase subunit L
MEIIEMIEDKNSLKIIVDSNEESLFYLLKAELENEKDVDLVGVYKEHHLIDKTELLFKVKKGNPKEVLKKYLKKVKKDLENLKL